MSEHLLLDGTTVIDDGGRIHHLVGPAIEGGQGAVYRTREPTIGVKVLTSTGSPAEMIERVRRLHVEDLEAVVPPIALLESTAGYVMHWMTGMEILADLQLPSGSDAADPFLWFVNTGGLRRRLAVCARLAEAIAHLHSRGLIYLDLNLRNVMVSASTDVAEVRLIDLDNLSTEAEALSWIRTRAWAAPEVNRREHRSLASDSYSLALVTFVILTAHHPFLDGRAVRSVADTSPAFRDALEGRVPSTIDANDTSNQSDHWLFRCETLLSPQLLEAYRKCFGAGRDEAARRPTAAQWRRLLWEAYDQTVACACGFTTYASLNPCTECGYERQPSARVAVVTADGLSHVAHLEVGEQPVLLSWRHLGLPPDRFGPPRDIAQLARDVHGLRVEALNGWVASNDTPRDGESIVMSHELDVQFALMVGCDAH